MNITIANPTPEQFERIMALAERDLEIYARSRETTIQQIESLKATFESLLRAHSNTSEPVAPNAPEPVAPNAPEPVAPSSEYSDNLSLP